MGQNLKEWKTFKSRTLKSGVWQISLFTSPFCPGVTSSQDGVMVFFVVFFDLETDGHSTTS